jgi:hypothetical protein
MQLGHAQAACLIGILREDVDSDQSDKRQESVKRQECSVWRGKGKRKDFNKSN